MWQVTENIPTVGYVLEMFGHKDKCSHIHHHTYHYPNTLPTPTSNLSPDINLKIKSVLTTARAPSPRRAHQPTHNQSDRTAVIGQTQWSVSTKHCGCSTLLYLLSPSLFFRGGRRAAGLGFWFLLSGGQIGACICSSLQSVERSVWRSVCVLTGNSELSQRLCCEDPAVLAKGPDLTGPGEERQDNLTLISPFWGTETRQLAFSNWSRVSEMRFISLSEKQEKMSLRGMWVFVKWIQRKHVGMGFFFNQSEHIPRPLPSII